MANSRPNSLPTSVNSFPGPPDNQNDDAYTTYSSHWSDAGAADEGPHPPHISAQDATATSAPRAAQAATPEPQPSSAPAQPRSYSPRVPPIPSHSPLSSNFPRMSQTSFHNPSRPSTAGSRTHLPSLTSRAFFNPLSSQRLQAQRGQRPGSLSETDRSRRQSEESEENDTRSRTHRNSTGSVLTTKGGRPLSPHQDVDESLPPPSRGTDNSEWQSPGAMATNRGLINGNVRHAGQESQGSIEAPTGNLNSSSVDAENAYSANRSPNLEQRSPRSFPQNFMTPSKQDMSSKRSPVGHEKLDSTDSSQSLEKEKLQKPRLGKNWEYFDGNTLFFCGGRLQTSKDKPISAATAIFVILPAALFFGFSAPWLWHNVSPAIPIIFAYMFYICMSSFAHACFTDPGVLPRNINLFPPPDLNADPLTPGPSMNEWVIVKSPTGQHGAFEVPTKYCSTCSIWRPPRCHHCRICNSCIDTQDHHCVWLNNCVGRRNYRYFFTFVGFASVLSIFLFGASIGHVVAFHQQNHVSVSNSIDSNRVPFAMFIYGILAFPYPTALWGYHFFLIARGQTTREYLNSNKFQKKDRHRPFNQKNWFKNWVVVLMRPRPPSFLGFHQPYEEGDQRFGYRRGFLRREQATEEKQPTRNAGVEMQQLTPVTVTGFQGPASRGPMMDRTPRRELDSTRRGR